MRLTDIRQEAYEQAEALAATAQVRDGAAILLSRLTETRIAAMTGDVVSQDAFTEVNKPEFNKRVLDSVLGLLPRMDHGGPQDTVRILPRSGQAAKIVEATLLWSKHAFGDPEPWYAIGEHRDEERDVPWTELLLASPVPGTDIPHAAISRLALGRVSTAHWQRFNAFRSGVVNASWENPKVTGATYDAEKQTILRPRPINGHHTAAVSEGLKNDGKATLHGSVRRLLGADIGLPEEYIELYGVVPHLGRLAAEFGKEWFLTDLQEPPIPDRRAYAPSRR